jgi:hypothetical protein
MCRRQRHLGRQFQPSGSTTPPSSRRSVPCRHCRTVNASTTVCWPSPSTRCRASPTSRRACGSGVTIGRREPLLSWRVPAASRTTGSAEASRTCGTTPASLCSARYWWPRLGASGGAPAPGRFSLRAPLARLPSRYRCSCSDAPAARCVDPTACCRPTPVGMSSPRPRSRVRLQQPKFIRRDCNPESGARRSSPQAVTKRRGSGASCRCVPLVTGPPRAWS